MPNKARLAGDKSINDLLSDFTTRVQIGLKAGLTQSINGQCKALGDVLGEVRQGDQTINLPTARATAHCLIDTIEQAASVMTSPERPVSGALRCLAKLVEKLPAMFDDTLDARLNGKTVEGWLAPGGPAANGICQQRGELLLAELTTRQMVTLGLYNPADATQEGETLSPVLLSASRTGAVCHRAGETAVELPARPVSIFTLCAEPIPDDWKPAAEKPGAKPAKLSPYGYRGKAAGSGVAKTGTFKLHVAL